MSVGLLLVTHNRIGEELLETACTTLGLCPLATRSLAVIQDADPDQLLQRCEALLTEVDSGDGVLVLTDAFGSTPSNIAMRLGRRPGVTVVSGLNLPMLLRVMNYPQLGLEELQHKAVSGGQDGVILVKQEGAQ
ncbi:PTS fructose transporter subunit IIA [Alkalilimnicola ehrlichii]|uniref:PTS fructose transporter subunit IIA n=1 Tax=Alkalilimnicola ehrlichii TaxID=351052 RepID=A0A3E0X0C3_9GAMM|nr:PTS fructose transporter subunit IIA [Alkalilimnicola ehrlichii]RFA30282.1 PTS fructose transporter subunit IIA [Alkalilimnicola ehrlichii]RFA37861.1 PTS fructose transporter subunit IIA [Alkalilimnicola ehrlichii]